MPELHVRPRIVVLALLLIATGPSTGRAAVKCLSSGTSTAIPHVLVVFPKFSTPTRGHCNELAGYEASTAHAYPASATACLNGAGSSIYIGVTIRTFAHAGGGPGLQTFQKLLGFELPYPGSTGGTVAYETGSSVDTAIVSDASLTTCHPFPMP